MEDEIVALIAKYLEEKGYDHVENNCGTVYFVDEDGKESYVGVTIGECED